MAAERLLYLHGWARGGSTEYEASNLPPMFRGIIEAEVVSHTYLEATTDVSGNNLDLSQGKGDQIP